MRRLAEEAEVSLVSRTTVRLEERRALCALERFARAPRPPVTWRPSAKPVDAVLELAGIAADIYASDAAFYRPLIQFLLGVPDPEQPAALG